MSSDPPTPNDGTEWRDIYLIAGAIGVIFTGGATVAEFLVKFGFSLRTTVGTLSIALLVQTLIMLYVITMNNDGSAT